MISDRKDVILAHIDSGHVPGMFMAAYKVTTGSGTFPQINRDSSRDILSDYINMTSIHFEASQTPGSEFEPGGVISAHLKFDVFNYDDILDPLSPYVSQVKDATKTSGLSYVYRMVIVYNGAHYVYGPYFAVTYIKERRGKNTAIEFDEVLFVLENRNCDVAGYSSSNLKAVCSYIMQEAGFSGFHGDEIYTGANYYNEKQINARQALSYIFQINGLFMRPYTYGYEQGSHWSYTAAPLSGYTDTLFTLDEKYIFDYDRDTEAGIYGDTWMGAKVFEKGADHAIQPRHTYCVDNNPFITQGTRSQYETLLETNICGKYRSGFIFTIPMMPFLELGDYIRVRYQPSDYIITYKDMIISRIEWDGGMFMRIKEAAFEGNR